MVIKCSERTKTPLKKTGICLGYQVLTITILLVSFLLLDTRSVGRALRRHQIECVNDCDKSVYNIPLPSPTSLCVTTCLEISVYFFAFILWERMMELITVTTVMYCIL